MHPTFVFTILIFSGLISAHPNINQLKSHIDEINLSNQNLFSERSKLASSPHQSKRSLFKNEKRGRQAQPGVACDGRIYKQSRVDAVAAKACAQALTYGKFNLKSAAADLFRSAPKPYTGPPELFPKLRGLTMRPISQGLLSASQASKIFGRGKNDFMVFSGQCTPVGIVRQSKGIMSLCASFPNTGASSFGGNAAASPIVPTRPPGAGPAPGPAIIPTRPEGAGAPIVPTRPEGAGAPIVPTRPEGAGAPIVPTRPDGAGQLPKLNGAILG